MYAIVQPCTTTIIANVIKIIYHALTCANALIVKMKIKVKNKEYNSAEEEYQ